MVEMLSGPWGPLFIFLLRIVDVSLATTRILLVVRGSRLAAPAIGFVEILLWVLAVGIVVRNLQSPLHLVGYAAGFSVGTVVGMWIEGKLALGVSSVQVVSRGPFRELAETLRERGFGVTELEGVGRRGAVGILYTVVRRRHLPRVLECVEEADPDAFVAVQEGTGVRRGWLGSGRRK